MTVPDMYCVKQAMAGVPAIARVEPWQGRLSPWVRLLRLCLSLVCLLGNLVAGDAADDADGELRECHSHSAVMAAVAAMGDVMMLAMSHDDLLWGRCGVRRLLNQRLHLGGTSLHNRLHTASMSLP